MCYALVVIKHKVGESSTVRCETEADLADREQKLQASDETLEYRVYTSSRKVVRSTVWESQP